MNTPADGPRTTRAALYDPVTGSIDVRTRNLAGLRTDQVLVRIKASGVCPL
jgi:D-arabinose 1-dehydrogenase-like Zn-dependent alcohol dehydrogenase